MNIRYYTFLLIILILGCKTTVPETMNTKTTSFDSPPSWASEAIWYQIFVERFRNGNTINNPTLNLMKGSLFDEYPDDWRVTPWSHNWYEQQEWEKGTGLDFYRTIQMRRYGGDLEGVKQKLPYLSELGINAIYFNPINDAPSLHKFDARNYHHVDVTFGGDVAANLSQIASEDPGDPSTWGWTEADKVFLDIINDCHQRGIRVVLDFSFNHTGTTFWAFQDIIENQADSKYKDWYEINSFKNEATGSEFDYSGWFGIKSLPELKKIRETPKLEGHPYEGNMPDVVKDHIYAVCKRWMDPNGDGDPSDGIDGMRLDVAEHVPLGFWRDFRKEVRSINPDFYLVGENWWTHWPDELMDAEPWVEGDVFDAVMHYQWYKPARGLFNQGDDRVSLDQFYNQMDSLWSKYRPVTRTAMMNLMASHDSPRFWTSMNNSGKYKYQCKPQENPSYRTDPVTAKNKLEGMALLIHQFTMIGAPHIWNGDEMGMWGADDPDNRKPLLWDDISFDRESPSVYSNFDYSVVPIMDKEIFAFYKSLIDLRKKHPELQKGVYSGDKSLLDRGILKYTRSLDNQMVNIFINTTDTTVEFMMDNDSSLLFSHRMTRDGQNIILDGYGAVVTK